MKYDKNLNKRLSLLSKTSLFAFSLFLLEANDSKDAQAWKLGKIGNKKIEGKLKLYLGLSTGSPYFSIHFDPTFDIYYKLNNKVSLFGGLETSGILSVFNYDEKNSYDFIDRAGALTNHNDNYDPEAYDEKERVKNEKHEQWQREKDEFYKHNVHKKWEDDMVKYNEYLEKFEKYKQEMEQYEVDKKEYDEYMQKVNERIEYEKKITEDEEKFFDEIELSKINNNMSLLTPSLQSSDEDKNALLNIYDYRKRSLDNLDKYILHFGLNVKNELFSKFYENILHKQNYNISRMSNTGGEHKGFKKQEGYQIYGIQGQNAFNFDYFYEDIIENGKYHSAFVGEWINNVFGSYMPYSFLSFALKERAKYYYTHEDKSKLRSLGYDYNYTPEIILSKIYLDQNKQINEQLNNSSLSLIEDMFKLANYERMTQEKFNKEIEESNKLNAERRELTRSWILSGEDELSKKFDDIAKDGENTKEQKDISGLLQDESLMDLFDKSFTDDEVNEKLNTINDNIKNSYDLSKKYTEDGKNNPFYRIIQQTFTNKNGKTYELNQADYYSKLLYSTLNYNDVYVDNNGFYSVYKELENSVALKYLTNYFNKKFDKNEFINVNDNNIKQYIKDSDTDLVKNKSNKIQKYTSKEDDGFKTDFEYIADNFLTIKQRKNYLKNINLDLQKQNYVNYIKSDNYNINDVKNDLVDISGQSKTGDTVNKVKNIMNALNNDQQNSKISTFNVIKNYKDGKEQINDLFKNYINSSNDQNLKDYLQNNDNNEKVFSNYIIALNNAKSMEEFKNEFNKLILENKNNANFNSSIAKKILDNVISDLESSSLAYITAKVFNDGKELDQNAREEIYQNIKRSEENLISNTAKQSISYFLSSTTNASQNTQTFLNSFFDHFFNEVDLKTAKEDIKKIFGEYDKDSVISQSIIEYLQKDNYGVKFLDNEILENINNYQDVYSKINYQDIYNKDFNLKDLTDISKEYVKHGFNEYEFKNRFYDFVKNKYPDYKKLELSFNYEKDINTKYNSIRQSIHFLTDADKKEFLTNQDSFTLINKATFDKDKIATFVNGATNDEIDKLIYLLSSPETFKENVIDNQDVSNYDKFKYYKSYIKAIKGEELPKYNREDILNEMKNALYYNEFIEYDQLKINKYYTYKQDYERNFYLQDTLEKLIRSEYATIQNVKENFENFDRIFHQYDTNSAVTTLNIYVYKNDYNFKKYILNKNGIYDNESNINDNFNNYLKNNNLTDQDSVIDKEKSKEFYKEYVDYIEKSFVMDSANSCFFTQIDNFEQSEQYQSFINTFNNSSYDSVKQYYIDLLKHTNSVSILHTYINEIDRMNSDVLKKEYIDFVDKYSLTFTETDKQEAFDLINNWNNENVKNDFKDLLRKSKGLVINNVDILETEFSEYLDNMTLKTLQDKYMSMLEVPVNSNEVNLSRSIIDFVSGLDDDALFREYVKMMKDDSYFGKLNDDASLNIYSENEASALFYQTYNENNKDIFNAYINMLSDKQLKQGIKDNVDKVKNIDYKIFNDYFLNNATDEQLKNIALKALKNDNLYVNDRENNLHIHQKYKTIIELFNKGVDRIVEQKTQEESIEIILNIATKYDKERLDYADEEEQENIKTYIEALTKFLHSDEYTFEEKIKQFKIDLTWLNLYQIKKDENGNLFITHSEDYNYNTLYGDYKQFIDQYYTEIIKEVGISAEDVNTILYNNYDNTFDDLIINNIDSFSSQQLKEIYAKYLLSSEINISDKICKQIDVLKDEGVKEDLTSIANSITNDGVKNSFLDLIKNTTDIEELKTKFKQTLSNSQLSNDDNSTLKQQLADYLTENIERQALSQKYENYISNANNETIKQEYKNLFTQVAFEELKHIMDNANNGMSNNEAKSDKHIDWYLQNIDDDTLKQLYTSSKIKLLLGYVDSNKDEDGKFTGKFAEDNGTNTEVLVKIFGEQDENHNGIPDNLEDELEKAWYKSQLYTMFVTGNGKLKENYGYDYNGKLQSYEVNNYLNTFFKKNEENNKYVFDSNSFYIYRQITGALLQNLDDVEELANKYYKDYLTKTIKVSNGFYLNQDAKKLNDNFYQADLLFKEAAIMIMAYNKNQDKIDELYNLDFVKRPGNKVDEPTKPTEPTKVDNPGAEPEQSSDESYKDPGTDTNDKYDWDNARIQYDTSLIQQLEEGNRPVSIETNEIYNFREVFQTSARFGAQFKINKNLAIAPYMNIGMNVGLLTIDRTTTYNYNSFNVNGQLIVKNKETNKDEKLDINIKLYPKDNLKSSKDQEKQTRLGFTTGLGADLVIKDRFLVGLSYRFAINPFSNGHNEQTHNVSLKFGIQIG